MSSPAPKPMPTVEEILETALQLPKEQRLRLAEQLRESADDEPENEIAAAWSDEIADRVDAVDRGELQTVSAREVFERLRAKHAR
jgi:putative addiction module component (TIGR02574 family)